MKRLFPHFRFFALIIAVTLIVNSCGDQQDCCTPPTEFSSTEAPGNAARAFLTADQYDNLEVEVDYMPGYEPNSYALNDLKSFLQARLHKSQITIDSPTQIASGGQDFYSADNIRSLEEQNRDHYTDGASNTLNAYFIIVDGKNEDQSNVVGFAYYNTSMAFFGKTIDEITSGIGAPSKEKVEGTVFEHEFGHNMGLVGNGTPTQSDHKTNGSAHCTTDSCLMQPAIETSDFFANIFDNNIPDLDAKCIADLQANGGK